MDISDHVNKASQKDKASVDYLKSIKKGVYIIIFNPKEELHSSLANKSHHIIEQDSVVVKPGKFKNNLHYRLFGNKSYNRVWVNKKNKEVFAENAKVFLIAETSDTNNDFEQKLEVTLKALVHKHFKHPTLINKSSEFMKVDDSFKQSIKFIEAIKSEIESEINLYKSNTLMTSLFNLKNNKI